MTTPFKHSSIEVTPSRRGLLLGASLAGGAALLRNQAARAEAPAAAPEADERFVRQPFYGPHQAGVVTPQPASAIFVAFNVIGTDRADLQRLFRTLTERIAFLTQGGPVPDQNPLMPPPDSGLLGAEVTPDNLTVTVSLGASLFDNRFGLGPQKPKQLTLMDQFPNDALDPDLCHGDVLLQFCANSRETNIHALRDIVRNTPDLLEIRWKMDGFLPPRSVKPGAETGRNLLGFKDGTANINAQDPRVADEHIWVGAHHPEPAWAIGGSYQVVRLIGMTVERWDRTPLREQEKIFGREKMSGAPLGMAHEHDIPDYTGAQKDSVPATAHIRLANPRLPETRTSLILRRGFNFSRDTITKAGQLEMGLLFCCYQSDLEKGFKTVQARLNGEALEEYIKPFGGGYFFVPPGARDQKDYIARALVEGRAA